MAAEARATGRRAAEEVRATTRGRDPGRRRGGREPTCSLAHAYYLRGGAIPPPQFTSRLLSHHILLCPFAFSPLASSVLTSLPLVFSNKSWDSPKKCTVCATNYCGAPTGEPDKCPCAKKEMPPN